nr:OmpA family protein [Flavobacterium covae]
MNKILFVSIMLFLSLKSFTQEQFSVYFKSGQHELTPSEKLEVEKWIQENKKSKILSISGYTDEDGTNQYNDSLAKKEQKLFLI